MCLDCDCVDFSLPLQQVAGVWLMPLVALVQLSHCCGTGFVMEVKDDHLL